jgi:hypothetical protein
MTFVFANIWRRCGRPRSRSHERQAPLRGPAVEKMVPGVRHDAADGRVRRGRAQQGVQALQCAAAAELALRGDIAELLRWSSAGWADQERVGSAAWPTTSPARRSGGCAIPSPIDASRC